MILEIEGAHRDRICVRVFIEVSVRMLWTSMLCYVILKKKEKKKLETHVLPCILCGQDFFLLPWVSHVCMKPDSEEILFRYLHENKSCDMNVST